MPPVMLILIVIIGSIGKIVYYGDNNVIIRLVVVMNETLIEVILVIEEIPIIEQIVYFDLVEKEDVDIMELLVVVELQH